MDRPLLILSDTHLSRDYGTEIGQSLGKLLQNYPDAEVILNGDIVDLSLEPGHACPELSLNAGLRPHREFVDALRHHVAGGAKVTIIPGNHDASLAQNSQPEQLRRLLGAENERSVEISPWFIRRDSVHIEHGHLYDPDCAPNHPLADANPFSEGLGTALMRRFVAPNDAIFFAHANQTTPSSGLKTAFEKWGARAPLVIANYFKTSIKLCLEAHSQKALVQNEREQGSQRLDERARQENHPPEILHELLSVAPTPTHHSFSQTFLRLYFDRIFAGSSLMAGVALLASAGLSGGLAPLSLISASGALTSTGALLSLLGGGYLGQSIVRQKNRYGDAVIGQLGGAAERIREVTQSRLVVLGHTHVEVDEPGYINLGSFGFSSKMPYLLIDTAGHHERRYFGD